MPHNVNTAAQNCTYKKLAIETLLGDSDLVCPAMQNVERAYTEVAGLET